MKTPRLLLAAGIGQPGESHPIRPRQKRLLRSAHLTPWARRMKFGWVLGWDGPFWHNAVGIAGPDWNGGHWLGGQSWRQHGPFVVCRRRRRGSLRCARQFARNMGCSCPRKGVLWPLGFMHHEGCSLYGAREDGSPWN